MKLTTSNLSLPPSPLPQLFVLRATKSHALNLARFVTSYKLLMLLQRKANGGKERSLDTFVAGALGGYVTFGDRTAVNEQVSPVWVDGNEKGHTRTELTIIWIWWWNAGTDRAVCCIEVSCFLLER